LERKKYRRPPGFKPHDLGRADRRSNALFRKDLIRLALGPATVQGWSETRQALAWRFQSAAITLSADQPRQRMSHRRLLEIYSCTMMFGFQAPIKASEPILPPASVSHMTTQCLVPSSKA